MGVHGSYLMKKMDYVRLILLGKMLFCFKVSSKSTGSGCSHGQTLSWKITPANGQKLMSVRKAHMILCFSEATKGQTLCTGFDKTEKHKCWYITLFDSVHDLPAYMQFGYIIYF